MSRSRPRVDSRCSFQTASLDAYGNRSCSSGFNRACSRCAKSATMRQSSRASPGGAIAARTRLMRRSLLVTVPSFSAQVLAGSSTSA